MKTARRASIFLLVAAFAGLLAFLSLSIVYRGFSNVTLVDIPRGAGALRVAAVLADTGVIRYRWQFLLARLFRPRDTIQAGEYKFERPASVWEVFERLAAGDVFYHELIVPEGYNLFDIAASLERIGVFPAEEFLRAARDPSPIRDLAPEARTLEGYLFPDTYRVTRHTSADQLVLRMTDRFRKAWSELAAGAPVHETVTLASLIEKEAALAAERPLIASVFHNRLRIQMKLDCDPTAIYAALLEGRYRGVVYKSDLESTHRYNTYQHAGLPPGPIASPGLDSLRAAIQPANTSYLYFVARPDSSGGHVFSFTLDQHQRAVLKYRRANHKEKQASRDQRVPRREPAATNRRGRVARTRQAARTGV